MCPRNGRYYCAMCLQLATSGGAEFAPALEVKDLLREGARSALQPSYVRRLRGLGITPPRERHAGAVEQRRVRGPQSAT